MKIIGLTGGIASGKSTAARRLAELGAPIIDTDVLAHELAEPDAPLWREYVNRYGEKILKSDGTLDRAAIGAIVFADEKERKRVDEISHPLIQKEVMTRLEELKNEPAVIMDVPLLFEAGWDKFVDEVWVVYASEKKQLQRLMRRDSMTEAEALGRINAQMPLEEKKLRADRVIDSNGTIKKTLRQAEEAWLSVIN